MSDGYSKLNGEQQLSIKLETLLSIRLILKYDIEIIGPCEHDVNYCSCDIQEALQEISATLKTGGINETELDTRDNDTRNNAA